MVSTLATLGNVIAASLPLTLHHAITGGRLTRGQRLHFGELLLAAELEAESPSTTDVMMKFDALVLVGRAAKGQAVEL